MISKKEKISSVVEFLTDGLYERDEIMAVTLLTVLSGNHVFLLGPPGTAKSLIARRITAIFQGANLFEILMNRFTSPDEIFGPISLKLLKTDDQLKRNVSGYLPSADFAFLDEIFKAETVLNSLLTILNEKLFKQGCEVINVPLKAVISASNETPSDSSLKALYDRFLSRIYVDYLESPENFEALLTASVSEQEIPHEIKISFSELECWKKQTSEVSLSSEAVHVIREVRTALTAHNQISDRRWKKVVGLLKASAFFNDRDEVNLCDALLMRHCLWSTFEEREFTNTLVLETIRNCGVRTNVDSSEFLQELVCIEKELVDLVFHDKDIYETKSILGSDFFQLNIEIPDDKLEVFIDQNYLNTNHDFAPVKRSGDSYKRLQCNFNGGELCTITGTVPSVFLNKSHKVNRTMKATCLISKGDKRENIDQVQLQSIKPAILSLSSRLTEVLNLVSEYKKKFDNEFNSLFVPAGLRQVPVEGITNQIEDIKVKILDCKRLLTIVKGAENDPA